MPPPHAWATCAGVKRLRPEPDRTPGSCADFGGFALYIFLYLLCFFCLSKYNDVNAKHDPKEYVNSWNNGEMVHHCGLSAKNKMSCAAARHLFFAENNGLKCEDMKSIPILICYISYCTPLSRTFCIVLKKL